MTGQRETTDTRNETADTGRGPADTQAPAPDPKGAPTPEPDGDTYDEGTLGAVPPEAEGEPVEGTEEPTGEGPGPEPDPLTAMTRQRDEYLDQLQRARADYDNLNKRRHREVAEARDRGAAALAESMLEVLDNFGFALKSAESSEDTQLAKGVQLVHGQLVDALQRAGLEQVAGIGEVFDPSHHEALSSDSDDTPREQPEVAEVLRTGYRFKTQLLRPASVRVME